MADEKNLKAVTGVLVNGEHVAEGEVIAKTAFANKGDWQNLVFGFDQPRMIETDEPVGKPKAAKAAAMPAGTR